MASARPRVFWLHFNRFGAKRTAQDVWTVHLSDRCIPAKKVAVFVPVETVYKGDSARQPRAFLRGKGVITIKRGGLVVITATAPK